MAMTEQCRSSPCSGMTTVTTARAKKKTPMAKPFSRKRLFSGLMLEALITSSSDSFALMKLIFDWLLVNHIVISMKMVSSLNWCVSKPSSDWNRSKKVAAPPPTLEVSSMIVEALPPLSVGVCNRNSALGSLLLFA